MKYHYHSVLLGRYDGQQNRWQMLFLALLGFIKRVTIDKKRTVSFCKTENKTL